mmetsp:Transcript_21928/g.46251  ORF Transcript_21928/g.46251 Transcript_21928/m.46251 type:complete len:216 (+) Transcript_21928:200-847(+)|eukprot:CAMPEP_0201124126 /NCGR_PEP_ID=MMETSP0850-20130426/10573_1 /ASSEMBLY_ACC=CAM_ASM_000622 /TAXON_ID=183588 /ORGANISM="Pseudo-nitzschia fraudulenta, Strain WWA7" /LENGTH=215 /DNA_ID=CAMNT_0047391319 /DNA_START=168 /DNA_END=815 /DNA_ORIENTATION=-
MTAPTDAQWASMSKLIQSMIQRSDTEPFRVPVDWKSMGLFDYPTLIKKPMDLGTVKRNINQRKYKSIPDAAEDIRLVWTNCMTYNQDGSDFFLLAKNLSKKFEEKYSKLINDLQLDVRAEGAGSSSTNNSGVVTLDEKRSFAKTLYTLSKEDLGKLIVEVDNKCPAALTKNMGEDEAELNVDKIPPPLFQELKTFVANCHTTAPATKKGTKRKSS